MSEPVLLDVDGPVATITLNRPERRNALTLAMWERLPELLEQVVHDDAVRVVVLRGAGDQAFAAGADISEFETLRSTPEQVRRYNAATAAAERALADCPKPTIAVIHGFCVGGGCELAVACDIRLADEAARFGVTPAKLGIVYAPVAIERLVRVVGAGATRLLLFSAELMDAAEALRVGLATRVLPADELDAEADRLARTIATRSQVSLRGMKAILDLIDASIGGDERVATAEAIVEAAYEAPDYAEGVRAFLERRDPRFR